MLRNRFVKRFLPVLLCIAMIFESAPLSVSAADIAKQTVTADESTTDEPESQSPEELPKAVINVSEDSLVSHLGHYSNTYDYTKKAIVTAYRQSEDDYKAEAQSIIDIVKSVVIVEVSGVSVSVYESSINTKWQQDGKDMAEGAVPHTTGTYTLVLSLDAIEGVCKASDPVSIPVEIRKSVVSFGNVTRNIKSGSTVGELKKANEGITLVVEGTAIYDIDSYSSKDIALSVLPALGGEALGDDVILQKNQDYILKASVELKNADNFEIKDDTFNVNLTGTVDTEIEITYTTPGKIIEKVYDGVGFISENDLAKEYTAVVKYTDNNGVKKEINDAEITGIWCDSGKNEYTGEDADTVLPCANAGTYFYKLKYTDDNGTYADAEAYIEVMISMVDIVIVPELTSNEVFEGVTAKSVTDEVTYKVYRVVNGVMNTEPESINEYYWGAAGYYQQYDSYAGEIKPDNGTQYFQPVFKIQEQQTDNVDGAEVKTWVTVDDTAVIKKDGIYRVVFSGNKATYYPNGTIKNECGINKSQRNYHVDVTDDAIGSNAAELKVIASTEVKVDVSALFLEGRGESLTNPIVKTYMPGVRNGLYPTKGAYKQASVKGAADNKDTGISSVDPRLTYTWERMSYSVENVTVNNDGNTQTYTYTIPTWNMVSFTDVENQSSPYNAGVYRLKVSLDDPSGQYRMAYAQDVQKDAYGEIILNSQGEQTTANEQQIGYVYYVIKPQDAVITLSGNPAIYADGINSVQTLLDRLQRNNDTVQDTYYGWTIYPVTVTGEDSDGKAKYTKDEKNPINIDELVNVWLPVLHVEKRLKAGDDELAVEGTAYKAGDWVRCGRYDVLEQDREYRLCAEWDGYSNYNFGYKLDILNIVERSNYFENESVPVTIKKTDAVSVRISVDESKITDNVKVFDGRPIDISSVKSLVKVESLAADGTVSGDVTAAVKDKLNYSFRYTSHDNKYYEYYVSESKAVHGGNYKIVISLDTDDTYRAASETLDTVYEIQKRELTLTSVPENVPAGISGYNINSYIASHTITGWEKAEGNVSANTENDVIDSMIWNAYEPESKNYAGMLKSSQNYYAKSSAISFKESDDSYFKIYEYNDSLGEYAYTGISYRNDYTIVNELAVFTPIRVAAAVTTVSDDKLKTGFKHTVKLEENVFAHTITPSEGVPYLHNTNLGNNIVAEGNYFIFKIYAPAEIGSFSNAVYENGITNAGGYITERQSENITVAFPAVKDAAYSFDILWEQGYVESFYVSMSSVVLESDFTKAVAPKSLAFNGAIKKMAAGESQQLDVKITKAQLSDIILLEYKSSDDSILKVNSDSGYVTAIANKGSATVEVYPCREENGRKVRIKGAKSAKVTIKLSDVAAPKLSKVTAKDRYAIIQYTKPVNGYRREIYVLSGKQKAQDFEKKIAAVKGGDYSEFVYVNFVTSEQTDAKGVVTAQIGNLEPDNNQYTVYLRNVSGLRTLDDGRNVAVSHAGSVKTFKTIKAQADAIEIYFDESVKGQTAHRHDDYIYGAYDYYTAPITGKTAKLSMNARFWEEYSQTYSDESDYIWRPVPLTSDAKKSYTAPKPVYYVTEDINGRISAYSWSQLSDADKKNYFYCVDGYYYPKAVIATVDKSGKVSFKGKGIVYIMAFDSNKPSLRDTIALEITASPDAVKGKSVKMQPGQSIWLSDYLEYSEKKIKVLGYGDYADLSVNAVSNEYFEIVSEKGDYKITALQSGKSGKLDLKVTDKTVQANGGKDTAVKITAAAIEPVKNLKAENVFDDRFTVKFSYSLGINRDFRIALTDARGSVISDEIKTLSGTWDSKAKKYIYEVSYDYDNTDKALTRLSNYNVSVKAVYNGAESKEAKLKIKTTNIPASYRDLGLNRNGGCDIYAVLNSQDSLYLKDYQVFKTGNTYPLYFVADNTAAQYWKTDALTWKSTNSKVASVKANVGTYSAALKTLKAGETTIEVTSKITKKVIARYNVYVSATGDAEGYFGENAPYNGKDPISLSDISDKDFIEITMDRATYYTLNRYEAQWFVFTAPEYGRYTVNNVSSAQYYLLEGSELVPTATNTAKLDKGRKLYVRVRNSYNRRISNSVIVGGQIYQEVFLGENKVKGTASLIFRAPEDNYYNFICDGLRINPSDKAMSQGEKCEINVSGASGSEYVVNITKREPFVPALGGDAVEFTMGEEREICFEFTAPEDNCYTFEFTDLVNSENKTINPDNFLLFELSDLKGTESTRCSLESGIFSSGMKKDQKFIFRFTYYTAPYNGVTGKLRVTARSVENTALITDENGIDISLGENETKWYKFTSDEDALYTFYSADATNTLSAGYYKNIMQPEKSDSETTWSDDDKNTGSDFRIRNRVIKAGETVCICVSATDAATARLKVYKRKIKVLAIGEEKTDFTIGTPGEACFEYTVDEDGLYTLSIEFDSVSTVYLYELKNDTGHRNSRIAYIYSTTNKEILARLNAGERNIIQMECTGASDAEPCTGKINIAKNDTE